MTIETEQVVIRPATPVDPLELLAAFDQHGRLDEAAAELGLSDSGRRLQRGWRHLLEHGFIEKLHGARGRCRITPLGELSLRLGQLIYPRE
ncbi:hypothetical protein G3I44_14235 [Halogeometricum borinquense]|uniref:MarR family transcriptional regulator n=1 Tax=Halogeometricum borinquense TaxID=60847 RepID=A0A6C0UIE8_9EURY|nr:hypothetical protein [Halogeometricum borinquense]QIB75344.1 hypothetical protein G3I44_14235 [Halogeometricum borinquense]